MKFSTPLDGVFSAPSHVKVLRVLFNSDLDLTGRKIADLSSLEAPTSGNALRRLAALHIIEVRNIGRAKLYRLKTSHPIVKDLLGPLFLQEKDMLAGQMGIIAGKFHRHKVTVILFGSAARGEETVESDLDICLVVADSEDKEEVEKIVEQEVARLSDVTGVVPTFLTMTRSEFARRFRKGETLVLSIMKEGKVYGSQPIEQILKAGRR